MWIKPVNPPSETPGWYLQRPPHTGILEIKQDGSWSGLGQLGNAQWPPKEGDIFDLAVTLTDSGDANSLFGEEGVVTKNKPIGVQSDIVNNISVSLK